MDYCENKNLNPIKLLSHLIRPLCNSVVYFSCSMDTSSRKVIIIVWKNRNPIMRLFRFLVVSVMMSVWVYTIYTWELEMSNIYIFVDGIHHRVTHFSKMLLPVTMNKSVIRGIQNNEPARSVDCTEEFTRIFSLSILHIFNIISYLRSEAIWVVWTDKKLHIFFCY